MSEEAIRELTELVGDSGVRIQLEGENLRLVNGKILSKTLLKKLKEHKQEIGSLITRDKTARENGFLILLSGEAYEAQYSKTSSIFIQKVGNSWDAWRETWAWPVRSVQSVDQSLIIEQAGFDYAMFKAKERLDFIFQQRR